MQGIQAQQYFQNGYQAALLDIETALLQGGEEAVREWLAANLRKPEDR